MKTSYAIPRPVVNTYLVRERDRRRWRDLGVLTLMVLPLGLGLLAYTWIHLEVLRAGARIEQQEQRLQDLNQSELRFELEAARLTSPARVAEEAQRRLGMRKAELEQLVFVEPVAPP